MQSALIRSSLVAFALTLASAAHAETPDVAQAMTEGKRLYRAHEPGAGLEQFQQAEEVASSIRDRAYALMAQGACLVELDRNDDAKHVFEEAWALRASAKIPFKTSRKVMAEVTRLKRPKGV